MSVKTKSEPVKMISIAEVEAARLSRGECRHCGGKVPCYSEFGDQSVGKRHSARTIRRLKRERSEEMP